MTKIILVTVLLLGVIFACRKETPAKLPSNGIIASSASCGNGVMDGDEEGVDCGGPACEPCAFSESGCSVFTEDNQLESTVANRMFTKVEEFVSDGRYVILITNTGADTIRFVFPDENIDYFTSYNPTAENLLDTGKVYVYARLLSSPYGFGNQFVAYYKSFAFSESDNASRRVHINKFNGKYFIEFCELRLMELSGGGILNFRGKFVEM